MSKKILPLMISLFLGGCAASQPPVDYHQEYALYSCPQLSAEHLLLEEKLETEEAHRRQMNTIVGVVGLLQENASLKYSGQSKEEEDLLRNLVLNVIGLLQAIGSLRYNGQSKQEEDFQGRLTALKDLAFQKKCTDMWFPVTPS
jgi:hypothetical protein